MNGMRRTALTTLAGLTIAGPAAAQPCTELDLNGCGCLNVFQVLILLEQWGDAGSADFDGSGQVDGLDLAYMLAHFDIYFETECLPQPTEGMGDLVILDATSDDDGAAGLRVFDVFVPFEDPESVLIGVHSANLACDAPPCFLGSFLDDSALLIGDTEPFVFDPNFSQSDFEAGAGLGADAGWYAVPEAGRGAGLAGQYANNWVQIARFQMPEDKELTGDLRVVWRTPDLQLRDDSFLLSLNDQGPGCYADFNNDRELNILDYIAFQAAFLAGDPEADCNGCGVINILDFVCFQTAFSAGCE